MKAERAEEVAGKKQCETSWRGLMSFRKEAISMTWKCQGKQQALGAEATVSYPEDLAKKVATLNKRFSR